MGIGSAGHNDPFSYTGSTEITTPRSKDPFVTWEPLLLNESLSTLASSTRHGISPSDLHAELCLPHQKKSGNLSYESNSSRINERRRSLLGWASGAMLDLMGVCDALDALELISIYDQLVRRLAARSPWLTPCSYAIYKLLLGQRKLYGDLSRLRSLERLAFLKDDPKMPIPIFREVEQCLLHYPAFFLSLAFVLFQLPGFNCRRRIRQTNGSLFRVAHVLSTPQIWNRETFLPADTFVYRFRQTVQTQCPDWCKTLPLRLPETPSALIIDVPLPNSENNCPQSFCLLEAQHLDSLLNTCRLAGFAYFPVRECLKYCEECSDKVGSDFVALMVAKKDKGDINISVTPATCLSPSGPSKSSPVTESTDKLGTAGYNTSNLASSMGSWRSTQNLTATSDVLSSRKCDMDERDRDSIGSTISLGGESVNNRRSSNDKR